jgi:glyoxylase-like metal-dependent hydrolase (beta-lactamase superfamily II)
MNITLNRRSFLRNASMAAGASLLLPSCSAWAQSVQGPHITFAEFTTAAAKEKISTVKLRDNIYLLYGVGGNIVCQTGKDGKILIDCQFSAGASHLMTALRAIDDHPLRLLINTHWHLDHTNANPDMHNAGARIIAHVNCRKRLATPQRIDFYDLDVPALPASGLPAEVFTNAKTLDFNGEKHSLQHTPRAHTDTDLFVHFPNHNVIHTGDLWFNGYYPLIDVGTGGTIHGMIAGVNRCIALADAQTKIVPGHGRLGNLAELKQYNHMLTTVAARVEKLKRQGKSIEEILATKPTAEFDSVYGKGAMKGDAIVFFAYQTV